MTWLGSAPGRYRARPIQGEPAADQLRAALDPLIKADAPADAEVLLLQNAPSLSLEARAEAAQRVAWAYYVDGRDADARRIADAWRVGQPANGRPAAWISGLACGVQRANPLSPFREFAETSRELEARRGGYFGPRVRTGSRRPQSVARCSRRGPVQ